MNRRTGGLVFATLLTAEALSGCGYDGKADEVTVQQCANAESDAFGTIDNEPVGSASDVRDHIVAQLKVLFDRVSANNNSINIEIGEEREGTVLGYLDSSPSPEVITRSENVVLGYRDSESSSGYSTLTFERSEDGNFEVALGATVCSQNGNLYRTVLTPTLDFYVAATEALDH